MSNDKITPGPEWLGKPESGGAVAGDGAAALRNRSALAWPPFADRKDFWVTITIPDQPVSIVGGWSCAPSKGAGADA